MNRARLDYVARQLAPRRRVVAVHEHRSAPLVISGKSVALDCGHTREASLHHAHRIGDNWDCSECGEAVALRTPEFQSEDPFLEPSYHEFVNACSKHCQCCGRCGDHPCPGSMAGGICDQARCYCDDEPEDRDDAYDRSEDP